MVHEHDQSKKLRGDLRKREIFSATEKPSRRIKIRIKVPFLSHLKVFFYIVILLAIFYFLIFSQIFKIKNVEIDGVKSIEISDYINRSLLDKNIILFSPGSFLDNLSKNYPIVQEARIVRGLPSTVRVAVEERKQLLVWCTSKCFDIDTHGFAYQEIQRPADQIVLTDKSNIGIKVGDQVASERFIDFYLKAIDELEGIGLKAGESYIEDTTFKLTFKTSEGWNVIFDTSESLATQVDALKQVLEKNRSDIKEYVDVRVEGAAYIK